MEVEKKRRMLSAAVKENPRLRRIAKYLDAALLPELVEIIWKEVFGVPERIRDFRDVIVNLWPRQTSIKKKERFKQYFCEYCGKIFDLTIWHGAGDTEYGHFVNLWCCTEKGLESKEDVAKRFYDSLNKFWENF